MGRIKVKYFGPIKEGFSGDGWIDIRKVTLFIGDQGSGKSCIAKLIATFSWLEKVLIRGDYAESHFAKHKRFRRVLCAYHRMDNYFTSRTEIAYEGEAYSFACTGADNLVITRTGEGELGQIMYIPSERNFVSSARDIKSIKGLPPYLSEFVSDYDVAKKALGSAISAPISGLELEYHQRTDSLSVRGEDYKIMLQEASSGVQSLVPVFVVSRYHGAQVVEYTRATDSQMNSADKERFQRQVEAIMSNPDLTQEQMRLAVSALARRFNKTFFVNIVEEPEQNLYPLSQRHFLNALLEINNSTSGNHLIMTTHSPYIMSYLSLVAKASAVHAEIAEHPDLVARLVGVVPLSVLTAIEDIAIYELDVTTGTISSLDSVYGIPSSEHQLNISLSESNDLFDELLDIEELLEAGEDEPNN